MTNPVKNGYLVVPGANHAINIEHTTTPVRVPAEATDIRFSLVSYQPMRDRPQFGAILQVWWTDAFGRTPIARDLWKSYPKESWAPEELEEGLPISGHAFGSDPGIVPHDVGPFPFVVEDSPAVNNNIRRAPDYQQSLLPPGYTHAFLKYTILGGNNGGPVYLSVVLEASAGDTPLECA